jgi:hypothetical protein
MEGSLGKNRVGRVYRSKNIPTKQSLPKVVNLTTKRALRGGADPKDVASRMTNPSANLRSVQGLQRFQDQARLKRKFPSNANPSMTAEGVQRAVRLMNKVLKKNRPVTDTTIATKAYADFIGMNKRQAAKQQRRGGAPESVMKKMTPSAINTRIAAMRKFTETGRAKREAALKAKGKV